MGLCRSVLSLLRQDDPQRAHDLREVFDALRWLARSRSPWRYIPGDLPPWAALYQQYRRWPDADVFAEMTHDLRELLHWMEGPDPDPSAVIFDSTTRQSTPESGARAGYDGHKRRKGSKVHLAVDTVGHLLALHVTPANAQERDQVAGLAEAVQEATGQTVTVAYVDQGYTGPTARDAAAQHGIDLVVVKLEQAKVGLSSCPNAASWSAALPGPRASAGWPRTTNDCQRWAKASISLPSSASCSSNSSCSLLKVQNRL